MANCCLCNAEFCKRKKGRLLSSVLPRKNVTLYEVLQMVCNYKVKVVLFLQSFLKRIVLASDRRSDAIIIVLIISRNLMLKPGNYILR